MAAKPLNDRAIDRILREHKARSQDRRRPTPPTPRSRSRDAQALAVELGIDGTPAFIIGDTLVPGEDMDAVDAAIAAARKKKG